MRPSLQQPPRPQPGETRWVKRCVTCGTEHSLADWQRLPMISTLGPTDIQTHLSVPAEWTIELRACCSCNAVLAAIKRRNTESAAH